MSINGRLLPVWQGGLIVLLVFLAYLPALRGGFVWDDDSWTTGIPVLLRNTWGLQMMWAHTTALQQYYPLSGTTFWLDYQLWKFWTTPYHVENVTLHVLAALLFWRLLLRLQLPGAWLAAALFALHPVMVESAAWITERKNVLCLALYLGALLAYERYALWSTGPGKIVRAPDLSRDTSRPASGTPGGTKAANSTLDPRPPAFFYGLAFVLFLCALLAKTTAFSLPAVMLLIAWWKRGQIRWRRDILPALPFFAVAIGFCTATAWLEKNHVGAQGPDFALTFTQRCLVAGHAFWFYLEKLFWPAHLCFVYPRWQPDAGSVWQWLYPVTAVGIVSGFWLARKRIGRGPVTALFFYVGTLFPVLGFFNAYGMRYSYVWDHWVYLSSLGIMAMVAAVVMRCADRLQLPAVAYGFAAVVLPVLTGLTWQHAHIYESKEILWRDTLAKNPNCGIAHCNLGVLLHQMGHDTEAEEHYRKAIEYDPNPCEAWNDLGTLLMDHGQYDTAIEDFRTAIRINPKFPDALINLGAVLQKQGRLDEAIDNYQKALQINPTSSLGLNNLGVTLAARGRFDEAIEDYSKAIFINPDYCDALFNLGLALTKAGRFDEAIENFQKANRIDPKDAETCFYWGMALAQSGRAPEAIVRFRMALSLNPIQLGALNNLAWIFATSSDDTLRNGGEAVRLAELACQLTQYREPKFVGTLAAAYAEVGRYPEAVASAKKAEQLAAAAGLTDLAGRNRQLLELYQANKPYHETAATKP